MHLPKNILAPTDFSELAEQAVDYAFQLAATLGAKVHILHAYAVPVVPDGFVTVPTLVDQITKAAEDAFKTSVAKRRNLPELGQTVLHMGDARDIITRVAAELPADLVVMGTHGRRGMKRMMLGSVTESVLRSVHCPVLAVPGAPPAAGS